MTNQEHTDKRDDTLLEIAKNDLSLETLETRSSDGLDFSDQAVWQLKAALNAAYLAGACAEAQSEGRSTEHALIGAPDKAEPGQGW
tara:strand:- start:40538 stop:40795 length:258 start_codon:yes stop_codon:yes gene_type:complete